MVIAPVQSDTSPSTDGDDDVHERIRRTPDPSSHDPTNKPGALPNLLESVEQARTREAAMSEQPALGGVQLGCGTLVIVALIVVFFSGGRDARELRTPFDDVSRKIDRLEKKIDVLSEKLGPQPSPDPKPLEKP